MQTASSRFQEIVWSYYRNNSRDDLPWRVDLSPYSIYISEMMLQQTQVTRVVAKYEEWMRVFPDVQSVTRANLSEVLTVWEGLGYYRRAKFVHQACKDISEQHAGIIPDNLSQLVALPGVGVNTAKAILVYAYNSPEVFIETNIRTVLLCHFFSDSSQVSDKDLLCKLEEASDLTRPREWYWALMDYGTYLKTNGQKNTQSTAYRKQSVFEGSKRQLRARVLKEINKHSSMSLEALKDLIDDSRIDGVVEDLVKEGFIFCDDAKITIR